MLDVNETLLTLTSDVVSAHVSNNDVSVTDLPALISNVYAALAGLGKVEVVVDEAPLKPAVSIRSSVKPDRITCLDCGMELKMVKRHLMTHHNLTPDAYRTRWNLTADYPLVAPEYAETRRDLAKKIGLGRKPGVRIARKSRAASAPVAR